MKVTKPLDLGLLDQEMTAASVPHRGLSTVETGVPGEVDLFTHDEDGQPAELPPEAVPVVNAHVAPPAVVEFVRSITVSAIRRTTDDQPLTVFTFPCEEKHRYRANLSISGIDAGNFVSREQEGRFIWKRVTGNAVMVGITVVSNLGEAASSTWAPNAVATGTNVIFTVKGAAGRTVDWLLTGVVEAFAPDGLAP